MTRQTQEPVTFEDVTVFLSRAEWDALPEGQRELYRDVVSDTYELLTSLGYPGPKPDILHRLERGEEPWICPSPGRAGSWLEEEPPSSWWPGAKGCRGPEEGPEPPCPGRSMSWCLRARRLLKKFGCLEATSEVPSEADTGVGSQAQPWLVKVELEDKPGLVENLTQSGTFLLNSVMEQQTADPWEQLQGDPRKRNHRNAQTHGHTWGEPTLVPGNRELRVEELRAAVAKDHNYSLRGEPRMPCCAFRPCSRWEHSYSRESRARDALARRGAGAAPAVLGQLARPRSHIRTIVRKAKEILRRYRPYWRSGFPWSGRSGRRAPAEGTRPESCLPTDAAAPRDLRSAGNAVGGTADTRRALEGILGTGPSPPAPVPAVGARKGAQPPEDPGAHREVEERVELQKFEGVSLQDLFRDVLRAVGHMLDSICQRFERQECSQGKSIWPIVIQIDNLAESGQP